MRHQARAVPAKLLKFFNREKTFQRQCCIKCGTCMAFAQNKTVAVRMLRLGRMHMQYIMIKHGQQIGHAQAAADVRGVDAMHHLHRVGADGGGKLKRRGTHFTK